jgi:hypothetical protein
MPPPRTTTVYLHTAKMAEQANYEETFRTLVNTIVPVEAIFIVVMSDGTRNLGILTKERILSTAEDLFGIYNADET